MTKLGNFISFNLSTGILQFKIASYLFPMFRLRSSVAHWIERHRD